MFNKKILIARFALDLQCNRDASTGPLQVLIRDFTAPTYSLFLSQFARRSPRGHRVFLATRENGTERMYEIRPRNIMLRRRSSSRSMEERRRAHLGVS